MEEKIFDLQEAHFKACLQLWKDNGFPPEHDFELRLKAFLKANPGLSKVALEGEECIGVALCSENGFSGYIFRLVVDEAHRGSGLGFRLITGCEESLSKRGIQKLFVNAEPKLVPWYTRMGFSETEALFLYKFI